MNDRPGLLVSVRSVAEAEAALRGGATIIDIKETAAGPLGKADDAIISDIVRHVAARLPVSAALGELIDGAAAPPLALTYVKWGLARCRARPWQAMFNAARSGKATAVVTAYADWREAEAPALEEVCDFACSRRGILLIDTFRKCPGPGETRSPHLLDWLSVADVCKLCRECRQAGVCVALAGSLNAKRLKLLHLARPHWFAVRGAACEGGVRSGVVSTPCVRALIQQL